MNDVLQLKGKEFHQKANTSQFGSTNLPKGKSVHVTHLQQLERELLELRAFWEGHDLFSGALVSVFYIDVIAKSRRVSSFLSKGGEPSNGSIVGASFSRGGAKKHIITHYVSIEVLDETLNRVRKTIEIMRDEFGGVISYDQIKQINDKEVVVPFSRYDFAKSNFINSVVDAHYIEKLSILENGEGVEEQSIVTIYKTDVDTISLMKKIGITILPARMIDETTILLTPDELSLIKEVAPYLIAMATEDISKLSKDDFTAYDDMPGTVTIPSPKDEPIVGVIDTMFREDVYFSEWVEFEKKVSDEIPLSPEDYHHGTTVSSIIVDGPQINPDLDDGCGRFRVRHFGVAVQKQFSSFSILKAIKEIVKANRDIKVWNLSLGSMHEINPNFISPEAAVLDKIQFDYDVIFVVAGTNKERTTTEKRMIGAPADSINSLVVNSVNIAGDPASYTREGLVLSFFNKPDICYFGGDADHGIKVCSPTGECSAMGTSYAAPWITRKLAYLIGVLGLNREVAKALIVDSAAGWDGRKDDSIAPLVGHGVVPQRVEDIVRSRDDEIKFIMTGVSEKFDTYTYELPIPIHNEKYPFVAKATMCYFPNCSRNQGVDYTNTELDILIGRINGTEIKSINKNNQTAEGVHHIYEGTARELYRKWDNTKHISETYDTGMKPRKAYDSKMWGVSVKTKERLEKRDGEGIRFGIVITLKELNGVNRIDSFINSFSLRGWIVEKIDVENRIEIYNQAQEEIEFE